MRNLRFWVFVSAMACTGLAWSQPPQGAKETVVIKEEAAPVKAQPKDSLPRPGAAPKPRVNRDPFVHGAAAPPTPPPPVSQASEGKQAPAPEQKGTPNITKAPVPQIAAPEVKVQGILLSSKGNRAIVAGPNSTFIVRQGDKLGDYKVASIADRRVVFSFKDKKFPIAMESEFPDLSKK